MSLFKSDWCVNTLLKLYAGSKEKTMRNNMVKKALSLMGHIETVKEILEKADKDRSAMGSAISGGNLAFFSMVPPFKRLEIVRERLKNKNFKDGLVLSINTVERFGDISDWEIVKDLFEQSWSDQDHHYSQRTFFSSFFALYSFKSDEAINLLKNKLGEDFYNDLLIYDTLLYFGEDIVNFNKVLKLIIDHEEVGYNPKIDIARKLLLKLEIKNDRIEFLRRSIEEASDEYTLSFLWSLAEKNKLNHFDDIAFEIMKKSESLIIVRSIVSYSKSMNWEEDDRLEFNKLVMASFYKWRNECNQWGFEDLIDYLFIYSENSGEVCQFVNSKLNELLEVVIKSLKGEQQEYENIRVLNSYGTSISFDLEDLIRRFINLASKNPNTIDKSVSLKLLMIPGMDSWGDAKSCYKKIFENLEDSEIDEVLYENRIANSRIWLLSIVSELGVTKKRIKILEEELNKDFPWPPYPFRDSIKNLWCEETFLIVLDVICNANWLKTEFYNIDHIVDTVTERITMEMAEKHINLDDLNRCSEFSRQTVQFWYDIATSKRK